VHHLQRDCEDGTLDAVCWAIGYEPAPLPEIIVNGTCVDGATIVRNAATSEFEWPACPVPTRLFGIGIRDPDYFEEPREGGGGRSLPGFGGPPCRREVRCADARHCLSRRRYSLHCSYTSALVCLVDALFALSSAARVMCVRVCVASVCVRARARVCVCVLTTGRLRFRRGWQGSSLLASTR
jgi:hypothetical protein